MLLCEVSFATKHKHRTLHAVALVSAEAEAVAGTQFEKLLLRGLVVYTFNCVQDRL